MWEVVDGAMNMMALEFMVRQYSYAALAIIRCVHECRYFCGVVKNPKEQRSLLENYFNECLLKNQTRGKERCHPLTF